MQYEMSHGDAVMILKQQTIPKEIKLKALGVIINNELATDYRCLKSREIWELVKFLYKEIENKNDN